MSRDEANRPRFHFTPQQNWMNDPNGLFFYAGEYHLFYQYNPYETKWGHMSWGHAVSRDLVHWSDLPVAMCEDVQKGFTIFSGSAVVDWRNSSGFGHSGQPPLVTIFTADFHGQSPRQDIHIAYSTDRGRTFTPYAADPVLSVGDPKFGDPKVFWHEGSQQWILVAILGTQQGKIVLYGSDNLKAWRELTQFQAAADAPGVWECPDLFPLPLNGDPQQVRWVVKVNCESAPVTSRTRYFVGDFDGRTFRRDPAVPVLIPEIGDLYAEVTYNDIPDDRRILIGWIRQQPSSARAWTGMQSVARVLSLRATPVGVRLCQAPVVELAALRHEHRAIGSQRMTGDMPLLATSRLHGSELEIAVELDCGDTSELGLRLNFGTSIVSIDYSPGSGELFVNRPANERVAVPLAAQNGRVSLHVLIDRGVVEVFGGQGEATIVTVIEPNAICSDVMLFSAGGNAAIQRGDIWTLASIW